MRGSIQTLAVSQYNKREQMSLSVRNDQIVIASFRGGRDYLWQGTLKELIRRLKETEIQGGEL